MVEKAKCPKCGKEVLKDGNGTLYEVQLLGGIIKDEHRYYCSGGKFRFKLEYFLWCIFVVSLLLNIILGVVYLHNADKLQEYQSHPLNKLTNLEEVELLQDIIYANNISLSNNIQGKKANWVYFYLDYSSKYDTLILTKVYKFKDGERLFEDVGHFDVSLWI